MFGFGKKKEPQDMPAVSEIFGSSQKKAKTRSWYEEKGWKEICEWVTELAPKESVDYIYIENFEVIPPDIDKDVLCALFNADNGYWYMDMDREGSLLVSRV